MKVLSNPRYSLRMVCAIALYAVAAIGQAQTRVQPAAKRTAPTALPGGTAGFGAPNPAGLPSPMPSPGGLTSRFPAGLPSPLPNPEGLPSLTVPGIASPGTPLGSPPIDAGVVPPQTEVMGAGGVPAARQSTGAGSGPYTALQLAQSFLGADANRDGELTRGEAQRLSIMPYSFEEMDRNRDGILSRFEYEDGVR